jgi:hypothetical protein
VTAGAVIAACAPCAAVAPPNHVVSAVDIANVLARIVRRGRTPARRRVRSLRSMRRRVWASRLGSGSEQAENSLGE